MQAPTIGELGRVTASIDCRDGWAAGRLLLALAIEDSKTDGARALAAEVLSGSRSPEESAARIVAFVQARVAFEPETVEEFESGAYTLARGRGDCDAHFRLVYALAAAAGLRAGLALLWHGSSAPRGMREPTHALAVLELDGAWTWAETTVGAHLGEHPNTAVARLGLAVNRTDVAKEVVIMTEKDLAPMPLGYLSRNPPAQVAKDSRALQALGFLASDVPGMVLADPSSLVVRRAVQAFQRSRGLVADGLLGPNTRAGIGAALTEAGSFGDFGYSPTIGGLVTGGGSLSADLTPEFLAALHAMALRFQARGSKATAEDYARVWFVESAGLHSHVPNGAGEPFGGMNQMGPSERKAAGFTGSFAEWLALSELDQLPFVERYYAAKPVQFIKDARGVYVATFAPAFLPKSGDPDAVLYRYAPREGMPAVGASSAEWAAYNKTHSDPYGENRVFDREHKGFITVADLARPIMSIDGSPRWKEIQARLRAIGGGSTAPAGGSSFGSGGTRLAVVVGLLGTSGLLSWLAYRA